MPDVDPQRADGDDGQSASFTPPLDAVDGAARVVDPILRGLAGERLSGRLFKDYRPGDV